MRISVIIAALDSESLLGTQLDGLAAQTYDAQFEVLVCDNGSTDGTRRVVESRQRNLPGLVWLDAAQRRGAGPARNVGATHAQGEWLLFCDADDVVAPDWVDAMSTALTRHSFVAGRLESDTLNPRWSRVTRPVPQTAGLQESAVLPHAAASNLGVHRDAFLAVGGFDESVRFLQDMELCWRLQRAGHQLVFVPDALVHVRLRQTMSGIFRQGWNYGSSFGQLERRYRLAEGRPATSTQKRTKFATLGRLVGPVLRRPSRGRVGHLVWKTGWHLGYRRPSPPSPASSRALD